MTYYSTIDESDCKSPKFRNILAYEKHDVGIQRGGAVAQKSKVFF